MSSLAEDPGQTKLKNALRNGPSPRGRGFNRSKSIECDVTPQNKLVARQKTMMRGGDDDSTLAKPDVKKQVRQMHTIAGANRKKNLDNLDSSDAKSIDEGPKFVPSSQMQLLQKNSAQSNKSLFDSPEDEEKLSIRSKTIVEVSKKPLPEGA